MPSSASAEPAPRRVLIRALGLPVLLPSLLYSVGEGAMMPVVALTARDMGASIALASFVVACMGIGTVLFDIPAGQLAARYGERHTMLAATVVTVVMVVVFLITQVLITLAAMMFVIGAAMAVWGLSRQAFVTESTPPHLRARALSLLGATHRVGTLTGPFIGAGIIALAGTRAPFYMHGVLCLATIAVLAFTPDPDGRERVARPNASTLRLTLKYRPVLQRLGMCILVLGIMRASRDSLIPLWASHIGLHPAEISLISGILSGLELSVFYPAGVLMDRLGRLYVTVPCFTLMALSHVLLPMSHSFLELIAILLPLGFGNGLGTGLSMTFGADLSPPDARPEFLGIWRLWSDVGSSGGPALVSAIAPIASLGVAAVAIGGLGLAAAGGMLRWIPGWLPRTPHPSELPAPQPQTS